MAGRSNNEPENPSRQRWKWPSELTILAVVIVVAIWRSRTGELMRPREDRPDLRVLFTSGYSGTEAGMKTPVSEKVLHKPYMKDALAQTVRKALD